MTRADAGLAHVVRGAHIGRIAIAVLTLALVVSIVLASGIGPTAIASSLTMRIVLAHLTSGTQGVDAAAQGWTASQDAVVWLIRLPRVLLAGIVGAALAMVGVALQAVTANRLADPHLLGVSAGATFGAVFATLFLGAIFGPFTLSLLAFAGAAFATLAVIALAHRQGRLERDRLLLSGIAVSFVMLAGANLLLYLGDQRAASSVLFWTLGGLGLARWDMLAIPAAIVLMGGVVLMGRRRELNALMTGDLAAVTLGVNVPRVRAEVFLIGALVTGVMVAVSGAIGFVGLVTPHACRPVVGAEHGRLLPVSALLGAVLLIWGDVLARTLIAPEDLPIGVVTALVGGGCFVALLRVRG
ncbi:MULTISPECIES: iron ABC transporter permease [Pandoraea]|uniref:FecCD family ABC transporter permease n=1 Tax=Pandoraea TaxID=93217 RepID=UPI001F5DF425|nr:MULTISPECIES: iron ABC transporter permease [Pandoraea]MCI3204265.1 ABC transporter permease [Pandoraea sp. LA3]MDN4582291.1 ABC transporter permease [Pandoraea capi]